MSYLVSYRSGGSIKYVRVAGNDLATPNVGLDAVRQHVKAVYGTPLMITVGTEILWTDPRINRRGSYRPDPKAIEKAEMKRREAAGRQKARMKKAGFAELLALKAKLAWEENQR